MKFICREITGITSFDSVVKIYDDNGRLFYFKENPSGKLHFNLPRGIYSSENNLNKSNVRKYKLYDLPKGNKIKKLPKKFKIKFINNPHKCSVDNTNHVIYFDNSFRTAPKPVVDYIKYHELGHYFYSGQGQKSEILCDLFAVNSMYKVGYNPSQVKWAQGGTLSNSETSLERKQKVFNHLKKH